MAESLEDRLKSHAESFNGLLALIPAEKYYGKDTSDQWQRKKQTKEEARAAKLAKLDPENAKSAMDVMHEKARKRKREDEGLVEEGVEGIEVERPLEGLTRKTKKPKKNAQASRDGGKNAHGDGQTQHAQQDGFEPLHRPGKKSKDKQAATERTKDKHARRKAKREATATKAKLKEVEANKPAKDEVQTDDTPHQKGMPEEDHMAGGTHSLPSISTASPSLQAHSPSFDVSHPQSGISSISSITPASNTISQAPSQAKGMAKALAEYKANPEELKARLREKIEALRAARHADTIDGVPVRTRQELLELRRRKQEQRSAHKKEVRRKARQEALQQPLALPQASPLLSPASHATALPLHDPAHHLTFGRIAFANGQHMTPDLGTVLDPHKQKGPRDPAGALIAARKRVERLAALDPVTRADIDDKDVWLTARKRAHGERVHDDPALLARTLKRKERAKRASEKQWGERMDSVAKGQAAKQKKREDNLAKRREEKGAKKGSKGKKSVTSKKPKVKPRPGFEGSFRATVGGGGRK